MISFFFLSLSNYLFGTAAAALGAEHLLLDSNLNVLAEVEISERHRELDHKISTYTHTQKKKKLIKKCTQSDRA